MNNTHHRSITYSLCYFYTIKIDTKLNNGELLFKNILKCQKLYFDYANHKSVGVPWCHEKGTLTKKGEGVLFFYVEGQCCQKEMYSVQLLAGHNLLFNLVYQLIRIEYNCILQSLSLHSAALMISAGSEKCSCPVR